MSGNARPELSLVFPVFDEERNIGRLLDEAPVTCLISASAAV